PRRQMSSAASRRRRARRIGIAACAVVATVLSGCSKPGGERPAPVRAAGVELPPPGGAASRRPTGIAPPVESAAGQPTPMLQRGAPVDYTTRPSAAVSPEGDISLDYIDTDIREIIRAVLGDLLNLNYSIDPGVQGRATIQTKRPIKREALLPTLQGLLDEN